MSTPKLRVAIFIDGLNTMFRLRDSGWEEFFDVGHLGQRLARNRQLVGVYFFRAVPSCPPLDKVQYWKERQHLDRVEEQLRSDHGERVRYGYMAPRGRSWEEKQVDVWLACEMLNKAFRNTYDIAILVTADTDLVPAVHHTRMLGKGVELLVFPKSSVTITQLVRAVNSTTTARRSFFQPYNAPTGLALN